MHALHRHAPHERDDGINAEQRDDPDNHLLSNTASQAFLGMAMRVRVVLWVIIGGVAIALAAFQLFGGFGTDRDTKGAGWHLAYRVKGQMPISIVVLDSSGYDREILYSAVSAACEHPHEPRCQVLFYPKGALFPPYTSSERVWMRRGGTRCCQPAYAFTRDREGPGEIWQRADPEKPGANLIFQP